MDKQDSIWSRLKTLWARFADYSWSLADQAVVSAASFVTIVLLARYTSASEVGIYVVGLSVLAISLTIQDSLVIRPYTTQLFKSASTAPEHAFSALALSFLLSCAISLSCLIASLIVYLTGNNWDIAQLLCVVALAAPLALFREFMRRFGFANMHMFRSFLMDLASVLLSFAALAILAANGALSATGAILSIALVQGTTSACWLVFDRAAFKIKFGAVFENTAMSWRLGRWLLPGRLAMESQGYMIHWVSTLVSGTALTGVYSASLSVIGLANPLLVGMFNVMLPKSVRVLHNHGFAALRLQILLDTFFVALVSGAFVVFIYFAGEPLMHLLFPGKEYADSGMILTLLSLSYFAACVGGPPAIALTIAERSREVAGLSVLTCIASVVTVFSLMHAYGLVGAVTGMLAIEIIGSILRWAMVLVLLGDENQMPASKNSVSIKPSHQTAKI